MVICIHKRLTWLAKGSHMTKVVWLPDETDYSYCAFVAPNTPYLHSQTVDIGISSRLFLHVLGADI